MGGYFFFCSVTLHPYYAAALSNRTRAGCVQPGKEASLVQREVAANAAGGIDPVPGRPSATEKAAIQNKIPRFPGNFCSVRPPDQRDAGPVPFFALAGCVDPGEESMAVRPPDRLDAAGRREYGRLGTGPASLRLARIAVRLLPGLACQRRSRKGRNASPPETGTGAASRCRKRQ